MFDISPHCWKRGRNTWHCVAFFQRHFLQVAHLFCLNLSTSRINLFRRSILSKLSITGFLSKISFFNLFFRDLLSTTLIFIFFYIWKILFVTTLNRSIFVYPHFHFPGLLRKKRIFCIFNFWINISLSLSLPLWSMFQY